MKSWDLKLSHKKGWCSISKYSITGKAVFSFIIAANIPEKKERMSNTFLIMKYVLVTSSSLRPHGL